MDWIGVHRWMAIHRLDLDVGRWTFGYWIRIQAFVFDTVKVAPIYHSTAKIPD